jgi:hypothetical protein
MHGVFLLRLCGRRGRLSRGGAFPQVEVGCAAAPLYTQQSPPSLESDALIFSVPDDRTIEPRRKPRGAGAFRRGGNSQAQEVGDG